MNAHDWFGLTFAFSGRGAVLAAVMSFPLMVRAIRLALEGVDMKLEQAARTLGAGRWRVFFTITLPLTLLGIIVGTVLAFASAGRIWRDHHLCVNIPVKREPFLLPCITLIQTLGGESAAARLCIISIVLAMISCWFQNGWPESVVNGWGAKDAETGISPRRAGQPLPDA